MKGIEFLGTSLKTVREFPAIAVTSLTVFNTVWKRMKSVGQSVREIRIQHEGQYRVVYVASFEKRVYVLHAFQKKTRKTGKQDLDTAKRALKEVLERQRS